MANDNELLIRINGSAKQFIDELDRVNKKTKELQAGLTKVAKVSAAGFAALAGSVGVATSRFSEFEKTFTSVQTLLDKSSFSTKNLQEGIEGLRKGVLQLGAQSGESFENLNQGLFDLISSGVPAEQSIETLRAATQLAAAGATDTATAVKALSASLTSFGSEAGSASDIAEKFFTAQKFGVTTVEQLATEFNKVAGLSKELGVSFDEALGSLSSLTANGAKPTAEAATTLRAVLNSLILVQSKLGKESFAVQDALSLQNVRQRGLIASLDLLKDATGGSTSELQRLLGSSEALGAVLSLTGAQSDLVAKQVDALGNAAERAATFQDALATKQATLGAATRRLATSTDAAAVTFGEAFAPTIIAAADALTELATSFSELDDETVETLVSITKFAAAATALTAVLATLGLAYIKITSVASVLNKQFLSGISLTKALTVAKVAYTRTVNLLTTRISLLTVAQRAFTTASSVAVTAIRGIRIALALLTGPIGIIIGLASALAFAFREEIGAGFSAAFEFAKKALDDLAINLRLFFERSAQGFRTIGRVTVATFSGAFAAISSFVDAVANRFDGLGNIIKGALTLDADLISTGLDKIRGETGAKFADIGQAAADAFNKSILEGDSDAKTDLLKSDDEFNKQRLEKNKEFNDAKNAQNDEDIAKERERQAKITEEQVQAAEQRRIFQEELQALSAEERALLDEEDIARQEAKVLTEQQIRKADAEEQLAENIKRRNQFLKDEIKFGTELAKAKALFNSQEVQGAEQTAGQLTALSQSKNATLKGIGKKAASVQAGIDTARGAIAAYQSLAGIPVVGPALGVAAAGALTAFGFERIREINAAQAGGIVPPGGGGARDRVPALLEPGELVVPRALTPNFIQQAGIPENPAVDDGSGGGGQEITIGFTDDAFEIIEQKLVERRAIGTGNL